MSRMMIGANMCFMPFRVILDTLFLGEKKGGLRSQILHMEGGGGGGGVRGPCDTFFEGFP